MAKKSSSRDIWQKFLNIFITPYCLGIVLTFVAVKMSMVYFSERDSTSQMHSTTFKLLDWVNQKGLDFQFNMRGERPVSEDIALVTIDEKAVEQEGRWPWPRVKIKRLVENLLKNSAKVIGFDVIFAEEDINSAVLALNELKSNPETPITIHPLIDSQISKANTDSDLAEAVKTLGPQLVMGVYFENDNDLTSYGSICLNTIYRDTPLLKNWEAVEPVLVLKDSASGLFEEETPEPWVKLILEHKQTIETNTQIGFLKAQGFTSLTQLNKTQKIDLDREVNTNLRSYCYLRFLNPRTDELWEKYKAVWPQIAAGLESKNLSFETAIEQIKNTHKFNPVPAIEEFAFNYSAITANLQNMGYFNAFQDSDGTIRRSAIISRVGSNYFPSLSLKTFLVAMGYNVGLSLEQDEIDPRSKSIESLDILKEGETVGKIPVNKKGELLINFAGPQKMFPHISVAEILNDAEDLNYERLQFDDATGKWALASLKAKKKDFLKDKILLIGATATGIYDLRVTSFEKNYPGLETHANIIDNLLQNNYYIDKIQEVKIIIIVLVAGIFFTLIFGYLGAFWGFTWALASILGYIFYDKYFMFSKGFVFPVFFPILLIGTLYVTITIFKYFTEERNKKMLKNTFQKYVSPAIVNEILSDPDKIELGGRKQNMTVFFSDVRGFTTISEKLDPQALSDLLNSYLTPMTDIVFKNRGTLDKYMGDAVMAFFGAPIAFKDHAAWGCRCALEQLKKLFELQATYRQKGLPEIDIGIGLNTGEMSVGNMGSETVRSYTVMGDAVNLGSRLEGINKQYGTRIIISEFTEAEIRGKFVTRELDWVRVKGKNKPVKIFELIAEGSPSADWSAVLKDFNEGYGHYHKMAWSQAVECFNRALALKPDDGPSKLYLERCLEYQAEPPENDWDGVFVMKTK